MRLRAENPEDTIYFPLYKTKELYASLALNFHVNFINAPNKEVAKQQLKECISSCEIYNHTLEPLSYILTEQALTKYRVQYRQFKFRQKVNQELLPIRRETHMKLKSLADSFDSMDQMFEHLLSPEADVEMKPYKKSLELLELESALGPVSAISLIMKEQPYSKKVQLMGLFEQVFSLGFDVGHNTKTRDKKKVPIARSLAIEKDSLLDELRDYFNV
jgi:hypothetical protein